MTDTPRQPDQPDGPTVTGGDDPLVATPEPVAHDAPSGHEHTSADDEVSAAAADAAVAAAAAYAANDPAATDAPTDEGESDGLDLESLAEADPRSKAELLGELVVAESKRDEYLDDLRRSHADFENYRRRILREGAAQREAGKSDVAVPLLDVLDDFDRTLVAANGSPDADLAKGVALVASKFLTTLAQVGLERLDAADVPFDPNIHEAVQQQPADEPGGEPVVAQVLRPGYRLGDRTLRPAMVVVAQ